MNEAKAPVDLKRDIRHATRALIEEVGYQQVQMRDIARQAGIGRATLYRHYPAKDQIAAEITQKWAGSFAKRLAPIITEIHDRKERVVAILNAIIDEGVANIKLLGAALSVQVTAPHLISMGLDAVLEALDADMKDLTQSEDSFLLEVLTRQLLAELLMIHNASQGGQEAKQRLSRLSQHLLDANTVVAVPM